MTDRLIKKAYEAHVKQLDDKGHGVAVFSTMNLRDKDGDVTLPGAFGNGQTVPIVPAHNWQHVPIGKGKIREEGNEALLDFQLNMKLGMARAWYEHLKFDLETPPAKQEWSYGFSILEASDGEHEGQRVRFLKSLRVHEVSPVLLGAGVNTRTLALKCTNCGERAVIGDVRSEEELTAEAESEKALALSKKVVRDYWAQREKMVKRVA